ncbi:hypothetical protein Syun_025013 [Stephania yunnanensis]|uniref:RING-type E3 ubiquitin transferase n=1 Tax=Stephania yunnanensis TaxID=152371 RepID=A0AAP0EWG0_9MAGN
MKWVFLQTEQKPFISPHFLSTPPPPPPPTTTTTPTVQSSTSTGFGIENKISPSILLIIIILAIIFFISGLLHLLVRFLFRPINREAEDLDNVTALQGQLQQLFHLHDSGVDQSYIDTLPVFLYKAIIGLKNPFDCAVCLCEFEAEDKLRLLPKCSHAFHLECIDTWLLSHSTCPLCRGSLLPEFPQNGNCSPVVLVLESGSESSREIVPDRDHHAMMISMSDRDSCHGEHELCNEYSHRISEVSGKEGADPKEGIVVLEEKIVTVKLGKFRNVDAQSSAGGEEGSTNCNGNVDARRCYSMGSFEYVMDESSSLQVAIKPSARKQSSKKPSLPLTPGHRPAMSECDCHSKREGFRGFDSTRITDYQGGDCSASIGKYVGSSKRDSFSISKIWLQSKRKHSSVEDSSRRAFSFRFPLRSTEAAKDLKLKDYNNCSGRTFSDFDASVWENAVSELGIDEEVRSHISLDSQASMPSFARKTLLWLVGRQNKVVHSSSSLNV